MVQNSESGELYIICKYGVRSGHYFIGLKVTFYMYSTKKRVALVSAMRADEIQRARGLVLTPWTRPQSAPLSILDLPIRLLIQDSHLILCKHIHEILP